MFEVEDKLNNYRVEFMYDSVPDDDFSAKKRTCCAIFLNDYPIPHYGGFAVCSKGDQFNKNIGRKIALGRALKHMTGNKRLRKKFWDAYFAARNGKY